MESWRAFLEFFCHQLSEVVDAGVNFHLITWPGQEQCDAVLMRPQLADGEVILATLECTELYVEFVNASLD